MITNGPPILIKGLIKKKTIHFEIESVRTRFKRQLVPISLIHKMAYHLVILLSECEKRNKKLLRNITLDTIYVKANDQNDPHVFIAKEDQLFKPIQRKSAVELLKEIFFQIGAEEYITENRCTIDKILEYLVKKIFNKPLNEHQFEIEIEDVLEKIYNIKKETLIYPLRQQIPYCKVITTKTPYYINCERDIIAVKWARNPSEDQDEFYEYREIKLMEEIVDCKNCAQLFGYSKFGRECLFFMRYYDVTLQQLANKYAKKRDVTQQQCAHLFTQIARAINDLHSKDIIHRDLKPENIMFEYTEQIDYIKNMNCVLIDFDRSKGTKVINEQGQSNYEGTVAYQPPEGIQDTYDASYDIWQLGYIMLCMLLREKCTEYGEIYKPIEEEEYSKIITPFFNSALQKFPNFCPLIKQMIEYDKSKRPKLEEVISALLKLEQ